MKHVLSINMPRNMWWSYQNCIIIVKTKYTLTASTLCFIPYLKDIPHVKYVPPFLSHCMLVLSNQLLQIVFILYCMELQGSKYPSINKLTAGFKSVVLEFRLKKWNSQSSEQCAWVEHTVQQNLANRSYLLSL